jgi:hypothetical protein
MGFFFLLQVFEIIRVVVLVWYWIYGWFNLIENQIDMCVGDMLKTLNPMVPNVRYTHHTVWCSECITSAIADSQLQLLLCSSHLNSKSSALRLSLSFWHRGWCSLLKFYGIMISCVKHLWLFIKVIFCGMWNKNMVATHNLSDGDKDWTV